MRRFRTFLCVSSMVFIWSHALCSEQLEGIIDIHVHSEPDSRLRNVDAIDVARLGRRHGVRALLLKNHYTHTASLAYIVGQVIPGIELYGGIVLNRSVGGINPVAIKHMAATTGGLGRVVWMPTFDSEHYTRTFAPNPNFVSISRDGNLLPEVEEVLLLIARKNLSLATGHSSPKESILLIKAAKKAGVERIVVTHPMLPPVGMSVSLQKKAASLGAFLEYPFNALLPGGDVNYEDLIETLRAVGTEKAILSSDLGQPMNPIHTDGLINYFERLKSSGFTQESIDRMTKRNPAQFLGLPVQ
jgi:hypothetical protein